MLAYATLIKKEIEQSEGGFADKEDSLGFLRDSLLSIDEHAFDAAIQHLDEEGIVIEYDTPDLKNCYLVLMPSDIQIAAREAFKSRS